MQIALSTQCYLGLKTPWFMFLTPDEAVKIALESGYDGIEYFPIRFRMTDVGELDRMYLQHILSGHQTWRSEKYPWEIWCKLAAFAFVAVPERRGSMETMLTLQNALDNIGIYKIPFTIYPFHQGLLGGKIWNEDQYPEFWNLRERVVQAAPDLLRRWNICTAQEFVETALSMGFTGIVVDSKHIRSYSEPMEDGYRKGFGDIKAALKDLLPHTKVLHVQPLSTEELYSLVKYNAGDLADILNIIKDLSWDGLVVLEVTSDKAVCLIDHQIGTLSKIQFRFLYSKILKSVERAIK